MIYEVDIVNKGMFYEYTVKAEGNVLVTGQSSSAIGAELDAKDWIETDSPSATRYRNLKFQVDDEGRAVQVY